MADYISREAAINAIWKPEVRPNALIFDALRRACEEEVKHIPSADVRPVVRGTWIHREAFDYYDQHNVTHFHAQCSNCGFLHDFIDCHSAQYLFCPECGADMRPEGRAKE